MPVAVLMNYGRVALSKIVSFNDRVVLDEEYSKIVNNIDITKIKDYEIAKIFTQLLSDLNSAKLSSIDREKLDAIYQAQIESAIYNSIKGGGSVFASGGTNLGVIASSINSAISAFANYKSELAQYKLEWDKNQWELEKETLINLTNLRMVFFTTEYTLWNRHKLSDKVRLTEKQINHYVSILKDSDPKRRLRRLERIKGDFDAFPPFWYHIGRTVQELGEKDLALKYYSKYELSRKGIFREDPLYSSMAMHRIGLYDFSKDQNAIQDDLRIIIENNITNCRWDHILFAALTYARIGDYKEAAKLIKDNIDEGFMVVNHKKLLADIDIQEAKYLIPEKFKVLLDTNGTSNREIINRINKKDPLTILRALGNEIRGITPELKNNWLGKCKFWSDLVGLYLNIPYKWFLEENPDIYIYCNGVKFTADKSKVSTAKTKLTLIFNNFLDMEKFLNDGKEIQMHVVIPGEQKEFALIYRIIPLTDVLKNELIRMISENDLETTIDISVPFSEFPYNLLSVQAIENNKALFILTEIIIEGQSFSLEDGIIRHIN